jgi:hypothetical protein
MTSGVRICTRNYPPNLMLAHIYLIHAVNYIKFKYKFIEFLGIATGYRLDGWGSIPEKAKFFSSPSRPDRLWSPPSLLSNGYVYMYVCMHVWLYSTLLDLGRFFSFLILCTVGRTPWTGNQPVARPLPTHRITQKRNKRTQVSMPWMGYEPTIPEFERGNTVHALDCAATLIGLTNGNRGLFPRKQSGRDVKVTSHFRLVPRSRMVELYLHSPTCLHGIMLYLTKCKENYFLSCTLQNRLLSAIDLIPWAFDSRQGQGPIQHSIEWVRGVLSSAVMWQGREANHSRPSTAEAKTVAHF